MQVYRRQSDGALFMVKSQYELPKEYDDYGDQLTYYDSIDWLTPPPEYTSRIERENFKNEIYELQDENAKLKKKLAKMEAKCKKV